MDLYQIPGEWQLTSDNDDLVEESAFLEKADSRKKAQVTTFFVDESLISTELQDSCVVMFFTSGTSSSVVVA